MPLHHGIHTIALQDKGSGISPFRGKFAWRPHVGDDRFCHAIDITCRRERASFGSNKVRIASYAGRQDREATCHRFENRVGHALTAGWEDMRSEEHTSELQSPCNLVCRLLLEKKKIKQPLDGICRALTRRAFSARRVGRVASQLCLAADVLVLCPPPYSAFCSCFFFFNDTATTEIYTLSLHDALPICLALMPTSLPHCFARLK